MNVDTKEIDRAVLGEIVFKDNALRRKLTRITGWYISIEILKEIIVWSRHSQEPILLDAPILYESKYLQYICFPIIVVYMSNENAQIRRIQVRDKLSTEEVKRRINSQMPISKKLAMADIKLKNDGDTDELRKSLIGQLYPYLL